MPGTSNSDPSGLADRLQSVRKRRGLTQAELAGEAGVSVSLIRQLEQGTARGTRLETAHRLAIVLRVPTSTLLSGPDAAEPEPGDVEEWTAVRRALEGRAAGESLDGTAGEPATLQGVRAGLDEVIPLMVASRYAQVRRILPALLRDADALVAGCADGDQAAARNLRSQVRSVTSSLMIRTWQFDAADHAAQLALDDAGDGLTAGAVADRACWALIRQGRLAAARELATRWADDVEPRVSRASRDELAVWGRLLLRVSSAAARDNRPGEAADALRLAQVASAGVGRDFHLAGDPMHVFGPMMVTMMKAESAMVQGRPEVTLQLASRLDGRGFPLSATWHRHRLDVANAHAATRQHAEAFEVLQQIRHQAPEWLVAQRYARDILGKVIARRRTLTPQLRELADFIRVPY